MTRLLVTAFIILTAGLRAQQPAATPTDTLVLNTGTAVTCRVLSTTETGVKIEYQSPSDRKLQTRDVPWADILRIDFAMDDEFRVLLKSTTAVPQMLSRWQQMEGMLSRRNHPAGDLGLAIARAVVGSPDQALKEKALEICGKIEVTDWDTARRDQARWLRVQLLGSLGRSADAITEARLIANDPAMQPPIAMQAHLFIAKSEFEVLKKLEDENPLWLEDDIVRPDRDKLFHTALDHFLRPCLFHGALEEPATTGLWGAVQLFAFDHDLVSAAERARDLIQLYPTAAASKQATDFLAANNLSLEPPPEEPEELKSEDKTKPAEPEEREPAVKRRKRHTRPPAKDSNR